MASDQKPPLPEPLPLAPGSYSGAVIDSATTESLAARDLAGLLPSRSNSEPGQVPQRELVFPRGVYRALGLALVLYVLYSLGGVLTPLLVAYAIAYVLDPLVDRLEAWRVPRGAGVAIVLVVFAALTTLLLVLVLPRIVAETMAVLVELPSQVTQWLTDLRPVLARYGVVLPGTTNEWLQRLQGEANNIASSLVEPVGGILKWFVGGALSVFGVIGAGLIVPVFAVYLLYDFDRITVGVRSLTPVRWRPTLTSYATEIDKVLGQFIRGQLIIMLILAVLYGGAYMALGVRLAIPIGIVAGMLNFVPYLGSAFALAAGLIISLIAGAGAGQLLGVAVAYAVIQTLEGFVITPRIVGKTVGLRDVWVLFALFVGGEIFGFMGVLLALPVAAVAKIFIARAVSAYRDTDLFLIEQPSADRMSASAASPIPDSTSSSPDRTP